MANPQKENGYTPIANEILDNIVKCRLNGTQFRIIMTVWRYTYGFSRKEHSISETFLSKAIGIASPHISREIKPLFDKNILLKVSEATFNKSAVIMFNKDYDKWQLLSDTAGVTENGNTTVTESGNRSITENGNQENNILKQTIKQDVHMLFFESVWDLYPLKVSKSAVSAKAKKELHKSGYDVISKAIENYISTKPEWQNYMNGSTFFNGRWKEYIVNGVDEEAKPEKREDY